MRRSRIWHQAAKEMASAHLASGMCSFQIVATALSFSERWLRVRVNRLERSIIIFDGDIDRAPDKISKMRWVLRTYKGAFMFGPFLVWWLR